jgi:hypothetical protein
MAKFIESDEHITLSRQIEDNIGGPIILINPQDADQFIKAWAADAAILKKQPGFISTQLQKGHCW